MGSHPVLIAVHSGFVRVFSSGVKSDGVWTWMSHEGAGNGQFIISGSLFADLTLKNQAEAW